METELNEKHIERIETTVREINLSEIFKPRVIRFNGIRGIAPFGTVGETLDNYKQNSEQLYCEVTSMKRYQLFLDESGGFDENKNGKKVNKPSSVAGYLAENKDCTEKWAKSVFKDTKISNSSFSKISIDPFHGLETFKDPNMTAFITSLLQRMCSNKSIRLVEFKNMKGLDIVNSNITYLNVLTEGIIQLIKELLAGTQDKVNLDMR